ncbi:MAG: TIR domain-containing protein [Opitutae bacterium]
MAEPSRHSGAVFISYAREDAEPARRIAEALRAFGVEVWFDANELRGGDAWDAQIKKQIRECMLFIPVISANTQAREEGYFRREWKLAVDRTHDMAENRAFLVPVIIDDTKESVANVPEQFLKAHCTRLGHGEPTPQFVEQVKRLLAGPRAGETGAKSTAPVSPSSATAPAKSGFPFLTVGLGVAVVALIAFVLLRPAAKPEASPVAPVVPAATAKPPERVTANNPDAKSIAVLPFVDMSQTKDQEYFSDGLSEELLNLLAKVPALQVTSRSSAFSYKGKDLKLAQVARELNVAHILEGSVRKSGNRLRITAQLIDARTDKHLWSETYDRSLDDIFAVQDEIAAAVVTQLKVTLLGDAPKAKVVNPKAYALFLQARQVGRERDAAALSQSISLFQQAIVIDNNLAAAWVELAKCYTIQADGGLRTNDEGYRLGREAVEKALTIDPNYASAYAKLGSIISTVNNGDLTEAARHFTHALELEPTNTDIMTEAMQFARRMGRFELVVTLGEYVVAHDPVNALAYGSLGGAYIRAGRNEEGLAAIKTSLRLAPGRILAHYTMGGLYLRMGDTKTALAEIQQESGAPWRLDGLALVYHAMGRKAESDAALAELISKFEKDSSWNIAYIHAFRGEPDLAFEWLDKAIAYRDPGISLTATQWTFTNLYQDPRWLPFLRKIGSDPEQLAAIKFDVKVPGR